MGIREMPMRMTNDLLFYKLDPEVKDPLRATEDSACFDLHSFMPEDSLVKVFINHQDEDIEVRERRVVKGRVQINSTERILVPTGLIFDIPKSHSVRLYPRSSLALKQGLTLANNVGIIDSDYVQPVYMMIYNISGYQQFVKNGERICQAELVREQPSVLMEVYEQPERKTDRDGGFGSTGKG